MAEQKMMTMAEAGTIVERLDHTDRYMQVGDVSLGIGRDDDNRPLFTISHNGDDLGLEGSAVHDLLTRLGVPPAAIKEYADNPKLLDEMVTYSREKRAKNPIRLIFSKGKVIHIQDGSKVSLTLNDVWSSIQALERVEGIHQIKRVRDHFQVRVVAGYSASPVREVDDVSHGGVCVSFNGDVSTSPYIYRLWCTNGMQCETDVAVVLVDKADTKEAYLDRFRASLDFTFTASQQALTRFVETDKTIIQNPTAYLIKLMRMAGIPDTHQAKIIQRMEEEVERNSLYELTNLVTKYARDLKSPSMRDRFEVFGANVCDGSIRCARCNTSL